MTPAELLERWGRPGRSAWKPDQEEDTSSPRVRSSHGPMPTPVESAWRAVDELMDANDLDCMVRAYEIIDVMRHALRLPPGTWCAVGYYKNNWKKPEDCTPWVAFYDEEDARRFTDGYQRFWDEHDAWRRGGTDRIFKAEQRDDAAPHMLFKRGVDGYEFGKRVHT